MVYVALLKLAFVGNWAELTVAPGTHPAASDMVLDPEGRRALKTHFSTVVEDKEQVGAVKLWPVKVGGPEPNDWK